MRLIVAAAFLGSELDDACDLRLPSSNESSSSRASGQTVLTQIKKLLLPTPGSV